MARRNTRCRRDDREGSQVVRSPRSIIPSCQPDAIGRAILYAIEQPGEQPGDVDVNEIVVRPLATQV